MLSRTRWMLAGAAAVALAAVTPVALAATPAGWQVVPGPNPGGSAALQSVAAAGRADFWAVGTSIAPDFSGRPLVAHQTGTGAWTVVDVAGLHLAGRLAAVSARTADDAWAVGTGGTPTAPLTAHFDGRRWRVVATPAVPGGVLDGVSSAARDDVWAVGVRPTAAGQATLAEHWNGRAWTVVPSPNAGQFNELDAVAAVAPDDVWAVGRQATSSSYPSSSTGTGAPGASSRSPYPPRTRSSSG